MHEDIWIRCEGTGCALHLLGGDRRGICPMCGALVMEDGLGKAEPHRRRDVLAMLKRGDFDEAGA